MSHDPASFGAVKESVPFFLDSSESVPFLIAGGGGVQGAL